ncbi:O-antigen ligase family protein [Patescibacteria group bacterium]|nr:O-antigen ligase family protein [Patescibacteria group bacterium]
MINYLIIKIKNSQELALFSVTALLLFLLMFFLGTTTLAIKFILIIIIGLIPVFFKKPIIFLYFLFLVTPSLRVLTRDELIFQNYGINFNVLIHLSLLFYGSLMAWRSRSQLLVYVKKYQFISYFAVFLFLSGASIFYSLDRPSTLDQFVRLCSSSFGIFFFALLAINTRKDFYNLIYCIVLGLIVPSIVGYYEFFAGTGWYDPSMRTYRIDSTFTHPVIFSGYLLLAMPILYALVEDKIKNRVKVGLFAFLGNNLFFVIASLTRGIWNAGAAMLLVFGGIKSRKTLVAGILIFVLTFMFIEPLKQRVYDTFRPSPDSSFQTRLDIIKTTFPAFWSAPFLGYGFGAFEVIHLRYNEDARFWPSLQAHNDYLRILIELGVIGAILYLSIFISLLLLIRRLYLGADSKELQNYYFSLVLIWIAAGTISLSDNFLRIVEFQQIAWAYTGAVLAFGLVKKESTHKKR